MTHMRYSSGGLHQSNDNKQGQFVPRSNGTSRFKIGPNSNQNGFRDNQNGYGDGELGSNLHQINWDLNSLIPFKKNFYIESPVVSQRSESEIAEYRSTHGITVNGRNIPKPIFQFNEASLDNRIMATIAQSGWTEPTPIQAQGLPLALSGCDVVGIAQTGSGKTGSFLIPAFIHILAQPKLTRGDGPICLVLVPTRELAQQVQKVAEQFCYKLGMRHCCC